MATEWTFEQKADSFRNEIRDRFIAENENWRKEEILQKEEVTMRDPGFLERNPDLKEVKDSTLWEIYHKTKIEITKSNGISIILPKGYAITPDVIDMFSNTEVAWSEVDIEAKLIDDEARIVLSIMLVDSWDDEESWQWREEKRSREWHLLQKIRTIV